MRSVPLHLLLRDYLLLEEERRVDDLRRDRDALHQASLTAIALHAPKDLAIEQRALERRAREVDRGRRESASALRAQGEAMARRMTARGVFGEPA